MTIQLLVAVFLSLRRYDIRVQRKSKQITVSVSNSNVSCFVVGDFNIDLCKYKLKAHTATTDYVNMLLLNNFQPTVVMPTRITNSSATLIDHMYYFEGNYCKKIFG